MPFHGGSLIGFFPSASHAPVGFQGSQILAAAAAWRAKGTGSVFEQFIRRYAVFARDSSTLLMQLFK
jgi:hypothetical protein